MSWETVGFEGMEENRLGVNKSVIVITCLSCPNGAFSGSSGGQADV